MIILFPNCLFLLTHSTPSFSSSFGTVCPHRVAISCEPVVAERPSWITCRSAVSNPAPRLLWAMEGEDIENIHDDHVESSNSSNATVGFFSSSTYSRGFVADDHGKIVRCCAARDEELGCTTDVCMECPLNVYCKYPTLMPAPILSIQGELGGPTIIIIIIICEEKIDLRVLEGKGYFFSVMFVKECVSQTRQHVISNTILPIYHLMIVSHIAHSCDSHCVSLAT